LPIGTYNHLHKKLDVISLAATQCQNFESIELTSSANKLSDNSILLYLLLIVGCWNHSDYILSNLNFLFSKIASKITFPSIHSEVQPQSETQELQIPFVKKTLNIFSPH
jgi:hypothetical protein